MLTCCSFNPVRALSSCLAWACWVACARCEVAPAALDAAKLRELAGWPLRAGAGRTSELVDALVDVREDESELNGPDEDDAGEGDRVE